MVSDGKKTVFYDQTTQGRFDDFDGFMRLTNRGTHPALWVETLLRLRIAQPRLADPFWSQFRHGIWRFDSPV